MKTVWIFAAAVLMASVPAHAGGEFMGDACVNALQVRGQSVTWKLGIFHMGGQHFLISGVQSAQGKPGIPVSGSGELIGGEIQINATVSDGTAITFARIRLDPSSLAGSVDFLGTTGFDTFDAGDTPASVVPCPFSDF